jgi:hypothetical protein
MDHECRYEKGWKMMCRKIAMAVFIGLITSSFIVGCGTTKKISEDIVGGRGELKKIALVPAANQTGYGGQALQKEAMANLETFLKRHCDEFIVLDFGKTGRLLEKLVGRSTGQIDNLTLAKFGRVLGVNAILIATLDDIKCTGGKRGIYGFRDTIPVVRLVMRLRAFDPQTGTILFDQVFADEVEVGESDWQNIRERKGYHQEIMNRLLIKTTDQVGEAVSDQLCDTPWKGYVTNVSGDVITLSAGKDVGLAKGDVLEVFGMSGTIEGKEGQIYLLSGPTIGELQITEVRENEAEAMGLEGSDFQKSSHVKLKD